MSEDRQDSGTHGGDQRPGRTQGIRAKPADVQDAVVSGELGEEFTLQQVVGHTGAPDAAVDGAIKGLVDEGKVEQAGMTEEGTPGRMVTLYRLVSSRGQGSANPG